MSKLQVCSVSGGPHFDLACRTLGKTLGKSLVLFGSVLLLAHCGKSKKNVEVLADPPAGTYESAIAVTLSASDSSTIYYRVLWNETTRSLASDEFQAYTGPVPMTASGTIEFFAETTVKKAGPVPGIGDKKVKQNSATVAAAYIINSTATTSTPLPVNPVIVPPITSPSTGTTTTPTDEPAEPTVYTLHAPIVSGPSASADTTPTWTWASGGGDGNGQYRYKLNDDEWVETKDTSHTPSAALDHGTHTLYVQESAPDGSWSESGSHAIFVYKDSALGNFYTTDVIDNPGAYLVIQTDPPVGSQINTNGSITLYFNDVIDPSTVSSATLTVTQDAGSGATPVYGTYSGQKTTTGGSLIVFSPFENYETNATVQIAISTGLKDDDGGSISGTSTFAFTTSAEDPDIAPGTAAISFEDDEDMSGLSFAGNAGIVGSLGVNPSHGDKMVMLTTAQLADVSNTGALNDRTSSLSMTVNVPVGKTKLRFDYDFMSEEQFGGGSSYDDTFTVSISGPLGAVTYLVASVNMAGASLPPVISFAGFDVDQYGGPRHTGWRQPDASAWDCLEANACQLLTPSLDISTLGSPLSITFTVSDVNDDQFTTIVTLDNIHFAD